MSYDLIITEKPSAANKIATALADGKAIRETKNKVAYYNITHKNKDIVVVSAVGHLYSLAEKEKTFKYPRFDIEWKPSSEVNKLAVFSKKYLTVIKQLAKDADSFTVATDYDVEGEVIGLNIVRYACKQKDASRMKFSTLTRPDLIKSYEKRSKTLDWGQAYAGETRHMLDWYYGINLSRALTLAIKSVGRYKTMSAGRVQGPTLKIIVDKEKEIIAFKAEPYWQLQLLGILKGKDLEAFHEKDKFQDEKEAKNILAKTKGKEAKVADVSKNEFEQAPPAPFDLTTLQTEAYRSLGISPKDALATAQELYLAGLISYPRTSSQQLPAKLGFAKILTELKKQSFYKELAEELLAKKELKPNNGKKKDPAHPAIYPTGQISRIDGYKAKIYDLIVRRFLATFAEPARRETINIKIDVNKEIFIAKGTRTVKKGWHEFYGSHVKLKEVEMPDAKKGDKVDVKEINKLDKETTPPKRYTPASIIKELEKRNLGTKATRSEIVESLYRRGYIDGKAIQATEFGMETSDVLEKYSPEILDEELTRHFEEAMEVIRGKKLDEAPVLDEAKKELIKLLKNFKKNEKKIGKELIGSYQKTMDKENTIGNCPNCDGNLKVTYSKKTKKRFIACDNYPKCTTTFSIPQRGMVRPANKICEKCNLPKLSIQIGSRKQDVCLNPECPDKEITDEKTKQEIEKLENGTEKKKCPKCGGNLVLRTSVYGKFLGCSNYPKCRHTEKLENNNNNK
ncbi:MAG: DNA topoisomerase I [archaeon]